MVVYIRDADVRGWCVKMEVSRRWLMINEQR